MRLFNFYVKAAACGKTPWRGKSPWRYLVVDVD
jgi:hypothetical protein